MATPSSAGSVLRWILALLSVVLTGAGSLAGAAPALAATSTYAYDTAAYTYDAPARLSSSDTVATYERGSPSRPGVASWDTPVFVGGCCTAANTEASAAEIIQSTARAQAARGAEELAGALSPAERAAMQSQPWLQKPMLGQAVHRGTAGALDEAFPGRFRYSTRGPDFLDTLTGERLELTTPGQVGAHLARPGYQGVTMCTYVLPGC